MTDNRQACRRRRVARCLRPGLAGLVAVALAAPACGDDGGDDAGTDVTTTTEPPATTSTTAPLTPEEEATAVYLELVDVVYRLLTTEPDPDDPELARLAVDPVLGIFQDNLATMQAENQIVERGDRTNQDVVSAVAESGDRVKLEVCSVGNDRTIDRDDGSIVDEGVSARLAEVSVLRSTDGQWQVGQISTLEIMKDGAGCTG